MATPIFHSIFFIQIILNSLQKYQPRLHITEIYNDDVMNNQSDFENQPTMTFDFPETIFFAVTAYQSEQVPRRLFLSCLFMKIFFHVSKMYDTLWSS